MLTDNLEHLPPLTDEQKDRMLLIGGDANPELNEAIANELGVELADVLLEEFADGHLKTRIDATVRDKKVFIVQPHIETPEGKSPNDTFMRHLQLISAARRRDAGPIWAVIPTMYGQRSDREAHRGEPIDVKIGFSALSMAGAHGVITVGLHSQQSSAIFDGAVEDKSPMHLIYEDVRKELDKLNCDKDNSVVLAPDDGRVKDARKASRELGIGYAYIPKDRDAEGNVTRGEWIGGVAGKTVIIVDDMIGEGSTAKSAAQEAKDDGAEKIIFAGIHPYFAGEAFNNFEDPTIDEFFICNTMPTKHIVQRLGEDRVHVVHTEGMIADSIHAIAIGASVSGSVPGEHYR